MGVHGALQRPSQIVFYYQLGMKPLVSGFNLNGFVFLFLDLFIYLFLNIGLKPGRSRSLCFSSLVILNYVNNLFSLVDK